MSNATHNIDGAGILAKIRECQDRTHPNNTIPFIVEGRTIGYVFPHFALKLAPFDDVFEVEEGRNVRLVETLSTPEEKTEAMERVTIQLRDEGVIRGWRGEKYEVKDRFQEQPCFFIERAAAKYFGLKTWGIHVNGYVKKADGSLLMWVAKRSMTKPTYPAMLDHIVAGGQPAGISAFQNLQKECKEEATINDNLSSMACCVGMVPYYCCRDTRGLIRDTILVYDLQLPESFTPTPCDGEVESFQLHNIEEVVQMVLETSNFKPNVTLVLIDFFIRHGVLTVDSTDYYEDIIQALQDTSLF